ncbi:MAG TPA: amino acid adenylation domain-containing protein, partial [Thermoanaerobaculia bacterium]|nr:amino acid adenylation domain-containing protein [Thermoanaerobaculia bacterium]
ADLPFEKLVASVQSQRDMSHTPIFQVMLAMQNTPRRIPDLSGVRLRPLEVHNGMAKFDLTLDLTESEHGLTAQVEYSTDLFDADRIRRLLEHLRTLLSEAVATPDQRLSRLALLAEAERRELLDGRNRTAAPYPSDLTIHGLFERQVERTPDAVAVLSGQERVRYAELNTMANRIAGELRRRGVGPETVVGLCLERGVGMVAAMLGVLKTGGAYLPLDAQYPARRLAFMVSDSGAPLLLTERALRGRVPALEGTLPILIEEVSRSEPPTPAPEVSPEALAYLIYTSGSTGLPKGVLVHHRAVVNLLTAMQAVPGFSDSDVLAAVTTTSFDIAGLELFLPLISGGRLAILTREQASDGAEIARELQDRGATVFQATPATWRMLLDSGWSGSPALRMLCGGEALPADLARALEPRGRELWNLYGPTETTIWSSAHRVAGSEAGLVPIGRPIANTRMYVLDRAGQPTPAGVAGELHIAGDGLARGYWNRPEATAEKFVPDAFGDPGGRLFRTGDLARYRSDATLEYLGRLDHQIKLRGLRIELQEIEAHLSEHPGVRESVVVARVAELGDKTLVAYLAGTGQEDVEPGALRSFLKDRLPDYMVPASYVWMAALPRNKSGKVDRAALPEPERAQPRSEGGFVAPRSAREEALAGIFAQVLRLDRVGARDDFFELGGHSLLATQVVSRIRENLRIEVPVRQLFETPIVSDLAEAIGRSSGHSPAAVSAIPRRSRAAEGPDFPRAADALSDHEVAELLNRFLQDGVKS